MTRPDDTFFNASRKGQIFLAALLLLQVILLAVILTRLDGGAQRPIRNAVEPCLYPYNAQPDALQRDGECLPHPTRVSGRA